MGRISKKNNIRKKKKEWDILLKHLRTFFGQQYNKEYVYKKVLQDLETTDKEK